MSKTFTINEKTYKILKSQINESKMKERSKKKFQIKNRWTGEVIYESEKTTYKGVVEEAVRAGADLSEADLYGVNLCGVNLSKVNLVGADLSKTNLYGVDLSEANMYGVDLCETNLSKTNLFKTNLSEADLSGAKFYGKGGSKKLTKKQVPIFLKALGFEIE